MAAGLPYKTMALNTAGLNEAYTRKQQGTANPTDLANLDYATGKGWTVPEVKPSLNVNDMIGQTSGKLNEAISNSAPTFTDFTPQLNEIYGNITKQMDSINQATQPTPEMTSIGNEVAGKQTQITNLDTGFQQGMNKIEDQAIPMPFITGQQASVQRNYNQQRGTLVAEESNLLNRLGLAQDAQKANIEAQKFGLSSLFDVAGLQMKAQDAINTQKQQVFQNAQTLSKNAQDTLASILEKFQGIDPDKLTAEATAQLTQLAQQAGIPAEVLFGGMRSIADQIAFDQSLKTQAANLAAYKAQPKSSGSGKTGVTATTGSNPDTLSAIARAVYEDPTLLKTYTPSRAQDIQDEIINAGLSLSTNKGKQTTLATPQKQTELSGQVTLADKILNHPGLNSAVGPTAINRWGIIDYFTGAKDSFLADTRRLVSLEALQSLIDAKAQGATFGALSDREMNILQSAATTIGAREIVKNGTVVGYDMSESDFKAEVARLKNSYQKLLDLNSGTLPTAPSGSTYQLEQSTTPSGINYEIIQ
jgi:hypothetical protein